MGPVWMEGRAIVPTSPRDFQVGVLTLTAVHGAKKGNCFFDDGLFLLLPKKCNYRKTNIFWCFFIHSLHGSALLGE